MLWDNHFVYREDMSLPRRFLIGLMKEVTGQYQPTNQEKKSCQKTEKERTKTACAHTEETTEQGMNQPVPLHSCPASHEPSVVVFGQMGVACLQVFINCIFTICCGWPFRNPNNQIQFKSKIHSFGGWGTAQGRSVCSEHKAVVCSKHHRNPDTFTST